MEEKRERARKSQDKIKERSISSGDVEHQNSISEPIELTKSKDFAQVFKNLQKKTARRVYTPIQRLS